MSQFCNHGQGYRSVVPYTYTDEEYAAARPRGKLCPACKGQGYILRGCKCTACKGSGRVKLEVKNDLP